jgi:hypothetical protein
MSKVIKKKDGLIFNIIFETILIFTVLKNRIFIL